MGHLYHGYVSHNQRVLFKSCAMATSKKIRHMKKIDLFLEFLHSWIDGHWWVDIGFEKHIKQLKQNIGCPIMFIPLFSQDKTLVVLY